MQHAIQVQPANTIETALDGGKTRYKFLKEPDWSRLELYYQLRNRLFGESIPQDYFAAASADRPETAA